jgi:hypothetical protein
LFAQVAREYEEQVVLTARQIERDTERKVKNTPNAWNWRLRRCGLSGGAVGTGGQFADQNQTGDAITSDYPSLQNPNR